RRRRNPGTGQKSRAGNPERDQPGSAHRSGRTARRGSQGPSALLSKKARTSSGGPTVHYRDVEATLSISAMEKSRLNREIWGVVIGLTALLIALSLLSYDGRDRSLNTPSGALDTHNWGGFVGAFLSDILLQGLGLPSFLWPFFLCIGAAQLFRSNYRGFSLTKTTGYTTLLVSVAVLLSI